MNEQVGAHIRVGLIALIMIKYFRDVNEQDVLIGKQDVNNLPCLTELLPLWVINLPLISKSVIYKKKLLQPMRVHNFYSSS